MVRVIFLLLIPFFAAAQEVKVSARMDSGGLAENVPLSGTVTVEHPASRHVDRESFKIEGRPLEAKLIKEVEFSENSSLRLSLYGFTLPGKEKGLYVLPPISVEVGGKRYSSLSTTYEISQTSVQASPKTNAPLELEPIAEAPSPMYPGQRALFGYKIYYKNPTEILEDSLPLLIAEGFRKIGSQQVADVPGMRQITQEVEAEKPGEYVFGPSYIIGQPYERDKYGRQSATGEKVRADAPPVKIEVMPLPANAPPSFNGAVGSGLEFSVSLLSLDQLTVGQQVELALKISGEGDLSAIPIPDLCCQPGFPGMFQESDMPPVPTTREESIIYSVLLRVLSPHVKEVPPIAFTYYDLKLGKYVTKTSSPIPLNVTPPLEEGEPLLPIIKEEEAKWPQTAYSEKTGPLEISSAYKLGASDLQNRPFGGWSVFLVIPFGVIFLYIVNDLKQKRGVKAEKEEAPSSRELLHNALAEDEPGYFFSLLCSAFLSKLEEAGDIPSADIGFRQLPEEGAAGEVRRFLLEIEERRYAGKGEFDLNEVKGEAEKLFKKIEEKSR